MNGTGPYGTGPVGRRLGPCSGNTTGNSQSGFGMGRGSRRMGRNFRNQNFAGQPNQGTLREETNQLRSELSAMEERIKELQSRKN
ncbi:MAG: DUF5320 domain-containing protein [Patescibacteria group bacterium]|nr:DUF5320 domain-containing protein [Patescibacteria group bacterium]